MSVASEFNKESAGPVEPSPAGGQALTGLDFSGRWAVPLGAAALALLCLVTYYPLQKGAFIWDDRQWLLVNSFVHHWKGLKFIWFKLSASPQYYPMVFSVFDVEWHLWGASALGYHLVNVLLQVGNALLLWWVLRKLRIPGAWLAAALFAIHPVQVETVGWVAELKNLLSAFFMFWAAGCFLNAWPMPESPTASQGAVEGQPAMRWGWYLLATGLYTLGLLSKTLACTLPVILLVLLWYRSARIRVRQVWSLAPWLLMGVAAGLVTIHIEHSNSVGTNGSHWAFSIGQRFIIAGRAFWFYISKLFWPNPLLEIYPRWNVNQMGGWQWIFPAAAVGLVAALWLLRRRIGRGPFAAILVFGLSIGPVLGFINFYTQLFTFVADHYQYIACIGVLVLAAAGLRLVTNRAGKWSQKAYWLMSIIILASLGLQSWGQSVLYESPAYLWGYVYRYNPNNFMTLTSYGASLISLGVQTHHPSVIRRGMHYLDASEKIWPNYSTTDVNLGQGYYYLGEYRQAMHKFMEFLIYAPQSRLVRWQFADSLAHVHRYAAALAVYKEIAKDQPKDALTQWRMAEIYLVLGDKANARKHWLKAMALQPLWKNQKLTIPKWLAPKAHLPQ